MTHSIDEVVNAYLKTREEKRALEAMHEEALQPINERLGKLETWLLGKMNQDGVDSYKTKFGTAYKTIRTSCQMADSVIFKDFIFMPFAKALEERYGVRPTQAEFMTIPLWNLVDFRALKKGVEEYIEDNKQVPPGLNVSQTTTVNVRSK